MKIAFHPLRYPYHVFRPWLIQPFFWGVFFLGPAFNLFRVDMVTQKLIVLGSAYPFEMKYLQWLPIGFYGGVFCIAVITMFLGRVFCGWACPHNIMTEWTRLFRVSLGIEAASALMKRFLYQNRWLTTPAGKTLVVMVGLLWVSLFSLVLFGYVVPYSWLWAQYTSGHPHPTLVAGQILFALIGLFLMASGHIFCKMCCPYGLAQSISAYHGERWKPMEIAFKGEREPDCKTCTACQQVCPVDIDPRGDVDGGPIKVGQFLGCWNCGECIDACNQVHEYRKRPGLLSFTPAGRALKRIEK